MTGKIQRLHIPGVGEGIIFKPGGVPYEADAIKQFPYGSYMRIGNKGFVYAQATGTLNTDMGCKSPLRQAIAYATIAAAAAAFATSIVIDVGAADGDGSGNIAADALIEGEVVIFPHSSNTFTRGITGNTATTGDTGGEMTITLDSPIPVALTVDTDHGEAIASPYSSVQTLADTTSSVLGIPTVAATIGQYLWLQVEGPSWVAPQGAVSTGNNDREVIFRHDGSLDQHDYNDANTKFGQHAGVIAMNAIGGGQGAPVVFLQIAH